MNSIPRGSWQIDCVILNQTTVINSDAMRGLEILDDEWVIRPSNQRFRIRQSAPDLAVLESNGQVYYAEFEVSGSTLKLNLSRPNLKETVQIEAVAITADIYSST